MVLIQNSQVFELSGINKANANTNGAYYFELSEFEITKTIILVFVVFPL